MYAVRYVRTVIDAEPCTGLGGRTPQRSEAEALATALRRLGHIITAEVVED